MNMVEFTAFFHAITGTKPADEFSQLGEHILEHADELPDPKRRFFQETQKSFLLRNRAYRRVESGGGQLPPATYNVIEKGFNYPAHIKYVLLRDGTPREIILGVDMNLRPEDFKKTVAGFSDGLSVEEEVVEALGESSEKTPAGRLYHVLKKIYQMIPPPEVTRYGTRGEEFYHGLQKSVAEMARKK